MPWNLAAEGTGFVLSFISTVISAWQLAKSAHFIQPTVKLKISPWALLGCLSSCLHAPVLQMAPATQAWPVSKISNWWWSLVLTWADVGTISFRSVWQSLEINYSFCFASLPADDICCCQLWSRRMQVFLTAERNYWTNRSKSPTSMFSWTMCLQSSNGDPPQAWGSSELLKSLVIWKYGSDRVPYTFGLNLRTIVFSLKLPLVSCAIFLIFSAVQAGMRKSISTVRHRGQVPHHSIIVSSLEDSLG